MSADFPITSISRRSSSRCGYSSRTKPAPSAGNSACPVTSSTASPSPAPGSACAIVGEITREKVAVLQDADWIFREEIARAGLEKEVHQYFAVLTDMRSVGVMGDGRTYDYTVALRGVTTTDFMTADWARIPYEVLDLVSRRIVNEVRGINRIVYDITSKPPATIEWL